MLVIWNTLYQVLYRKLIFYNVLEHALSIMVHRYETYLWEHEQRYYQRCAVLFGSLTQLHRLHTDKSLKLPSTADTNTLNMSATVPRFTYLPIRYVDYIYKTSQFLNVPLTRAEIKVSNIHIGIRLMYSRGMAFRRWQMRSCRSSVLAARRLTQLEPKGHGSIMHGQIFKTFNPHNGNQSVHL